MEEDDTDWIERMCSFLDRWSTEKRTAIVLSVIAGCVSAWSCAGCLASADEQAQASRRAIAEHIQWLSRLPETEKKHWPITKVCLPGEHSCECPYAGGDVVDYMEILANGDVACHQTK